MTDKPVDTDRLFFALSDKTRRHLLAHMALGPRTVSELAGALEISVPAAMQHLAILEEAGLAATEKSGRVRTCRIDPRGFNALETWTRSHRMLWEQRLDRLSEFFGNIGNDTSGADN